MKRIGKEWAKSFCISYFKTFAVNKNPDVRKNFFVPAFTFSAKCQIEKPSINFFSKWAKS